MPKETGYKPKFSADDQFALGEFGSTALSDPDISNSPSLKDRLGKAITRPKRVQVEKELEQLSRVMDTYFRIPILGWRFGLNLIIDLIPGIGDWATSIVALVILIAAVRYRVPKLALLRMGINIAIYFIVGLIPFVGDILGAWWKPNRRNLSLLEQRATLSGPDARKAKTSDWLFVGAIVLFLFGLLLGSLVVTLLILRAVVTQLNS